ncbi:DUF6499 domain-containing protein [uncultured Roseobacter sp.]
MPTNWRNETDYDYVSDLDASGLAWECLRRNPRYRAAFPTLTNSEAAAWGLRFPGRPRPERDRSRALLETIRRTSGHRISRRSASQRNDAFRSRKGHSQYTSRH